MALSAILEKPNLLLHQLSRACNLLSCIDPGPGARLDKILIKHWKLADNPISERNAGQESASMKRTVLGNLKLGLS